MNPCNLPSVDCIMSLAEKQPICWLPTGYLTYKLIVKEQTSKENESDHIKNSRDRGSETDETKLVNKETLFLAKLRYILE